MKSKLTHRKTTLANGLRIITVPMKNTSAVTAMVFVKAGSRYERKEENGISHLLEHLFFEGTKKRPDTAIKRELDRIGAMNNAYTSFDHTAYYVKADAKFFDLSMDVLSDMYLNSLFRPVSIEKERRVVVEEIRMYQDTPRKHVWDNFYRLLYPNNSLGWPITGPEKTVLSLKRNNFLSYMKRFYSAPNTIIVIAGNVHEKQAIEKVKKYFKRIPKGKASLFPPVVDAQKKPRVHVEYKKIDQAHLVLGVNAYSASDPRRYALEVLAAIMGGYFSSRLMLSVRDKLGLAYYVGCDVNQHEDVGTFSAYAGLNLKNVNVGISAIMKEFKKILKTPISQQEIDDAKSHIEGALSLQIEASDNVAMHAGWSEVLSGKIETPEEYMKHIRKVNADDLRATAQDLLKPERLNLAIIGPFTKEEEGRFQSLLQV